MMISKPVNVLCTQENSVDVDLNRSNQQQITEVVTNTFLINLQQAIFGLEIEGGMNDTIINKESGDKTPSVLKKPRHFITGTEFTTEELQLILNKAKAIKKNPELYHQALANKGLAMIFEKASFRTRLSFAMAIQSMGGIAIESVSNTRKQETPADMIRVLNGYADIVMIRTHEESIIEEMLAFSKIPIINGLSALHHPCQILADLLSLQEQFGSLAGLTLAYVGDGNNILNSLMLLAPQLGLKINYCCPESKQPNASILKQVKMKTIGMVQGFSKPEEAVKDVHVVYTDVWISMGFEEDENNDVFQGFQVNEALMACAKPEAVFMHCMPMQRGKEVSETLADSASSIIFKQSENRLHVQKALMWFLSYVK